MSEEKILPRYKGLYSTFERKGGAAPTATHYCAGCGHGILHKLIGEAMADLGIQDNAVMISPVGCAVFGYYYFDCGNLQAAHGRAPAVGTGVTRALKDAVVMSYQGDGDLCSIGLNETFQSANRGENLAIFFVNNAIYGMTGGQMAPTTLIGQKTTTSPLGRNADDTGYPLHACELFDVLKAPVYIERVSLADAKRIRKARQAVRKALQIQKEHKGFTFVEFLSPCPTNMHCDAIESARFVAEEMEKEYPLGCFRDKSAEATAKPQRVCRYDADALEEAFSDYSAVGEDPVFDEGIARSRIKLAGFGGQGVLSLGLMLARAGKATQRFVTWMPSYGPEQRGGTCNCSVVVSGKPIGSPIFGDPDLLVAMNQPSLERFGPTVPASGTIVYDAAIGDSYTSPSGCRCIAVPAHDIATEAGVPKAANTAMLGVLAATGVTGLPASSFDDALSETFGKKPKLIPINRKVMATASEWARNSGLV